MRIDVNLQQWSEIVSSVCDRPTPYEDLTEVDQVTDRLVLERLEQLFGYLNPEDQLKAQAIFDRKLAELREKQGDSGKWPP